MDNLPKGNWTKNLEKFPPFKECIIQNYAAKMDSGVKSSHSSGYRMYKADKVSGVLINYGTDYIFVKSKVQASMKNIHYQNFIQLDGGNEITSAFCQCVAGKSKCCKHIFALLWQLVEHSTDALMGLRTFIADDIASTSKKRLWGCGHENKAVKKPFKDLKFMKHDMKKEVTKKNNLQVNPSSKKSNDYNKCLENMSSQINSNLIEKHSKLLRECGLNCFSDVLNTNNNKPEDLSLMLDHDAPIKQDLELPLMVKWESTAKTIIAVSDLDILPHFKELIQRCSCSLDDARKIEQYTKEQSFSDMWRNERSFRVTSSKFGLIIRRKKNINETFINQIWTKKRISSSFTKMGLDNENKALEKYLKLNKHFDSFKCGLVINPGVPFLATSPDQLIFNNLTGEYHLLEIKTLVKGGLLDKLNIRDCIEQGKAPYLQIVKNEISLKKNHPYFFQIQGQLAITGLTRCHLMVDSGSDIFLEDIKFVEEDWIDTYLPILTNFFFKFFPYEKMYGS